MPELLQPQTLHELVSLTNNDGKNRKVVGYSIPSYAGVLSALEKAKIISGGGNDVIMGVRSYDFSNVAGMVYDDSGFSSDLTSGVWKMSLTFHGATPIKQTSESWYEIVKFPNDNESRAESMDAYRRCCPYFLSQEGLDWSKEENFSVGAYIDLRNLGVKYFNKFYANGGTFYNETIISKLVYGGYMVALIVFPLKNTYKLVKILGKLPISNCATISLNCSLLACLGWEDLGVVIRVKQNGTNPVQFMPNGSEYIHPCQGEVYYYVNGRINNFNRTNFRERWMRYSMLSFASSPKVLEMELPSMSECYVRLFVPKEFREEVLSVIGTPPNEYIFQEYPGRIEYVLPNVAEFVADASSIMAGTIRKWSTVGKTQGVGTGTNKIAYSMPNRPSVLIRGNGPTFISATESLPFKPVFGHPNNINGFDCSSFVSLVFWDSGIARDDVNSVPCFSSETLCSPSIVGTINQYLKENYEAKYIDLVDESQVQCGDILCITKEERLRFHNQIKNFGHAALACPEGDKQYTLELGDRTSSTTKKIGRRYSYYKHIIRIVEKQNQTI